VASAVFKTVVGREERPGCVRFARASASFFDVRPVPTGPVVRVMMEMSRAGSVRWQPPSVHGGDHVEECELRRRVRDLGVGCDGDACAFWARLGLTGEPQCAVKYFRLLEGNGSELAGWLMSLKDEQIVQFLGPDHIPAR